MECTLLCIKPKSHVIAKPNDDLQQQKYSKPKQSVVFKSIFTHTLYNLQIRSLTLHHLSSFIISLPTVQIPLLVVSLLFSLSYFREEYGRLFDFVNGKHLRIKNTGKVTNSSKLFRPSNGFFSGSKSWHNDVKQNVLTSQMKELSNC